MTTERLPDFLVAGVAKSGTTSLHRYLAQHPDVFIPEMKETFHFIAPVHAQIPPQDPHREKIQRRTVASWDEYEAQFRSSGGRRARGEVGTFYAYHHETAIPAIRSRLGDPRILLVLRHPAERAFSAYTHFRGFGLERGTFEEGLAAEERRRREGWYAMWHYRAVGFYAAQVEAFRGAFSRVRVFLHDDLRDRPRETMRDILSFLGVDETVELDLSVKHQVSGRPKSRVLHELIAQESRLRRLVRPLARALLTEEQRDRFVSRFRMRNLGREKMDPARRAQLCAEYRGDVERLERLTGRDLSAWKA
jgi:hypothetical protein